MTDLPWLDEYNPNFPNTRQALLDPNGLLAVGGSLSVNSLVKAYSLGIFPWFSDDQPILWWSPSPRMVLNPKDTHFPRSLKKLARKTPFKITCDTCFSEVIDACSDIDRPDQDGTWITDEMRDAYLDMHDAGYAHSIEAWQEGKLVGGLYGIALGGAFFGESMFSGVSGASKIAFATLSEQLKEWGFVLIDCQIHTAYLESFGAQEIERNVFEKKLHKALTLEKPKESMSLWADWTQTETGFSG